MTSMSGLSLFISKSETSGNSFDDVICGITKVSHFHIPINLEDGCSSQNSIIFDLYSSDLLDDNFTSS